MKKKLKIASLFFIILLGFPLAGKSSSKFYKEAVKVIKNDVLEDANWAMAQEPVTVTASSSNRSAGGKNDFFSEGDYWWPDPQNPDGPYIQKDGMTNPDNFVAHRLAMIRFGRIVGALASAYKITGDKKYLTKIEEHLNAWFANPQTKMNPNLLYAQAIKGRFTGRGIGIIDTIHLIEVAQSVYILSNKLNAGLVADVKKWFNEYLHWLTTHPYGTAEMNATNNHGTCFVLQVAAFSKLTGNQELHDFCVKRYKEVLLPNQMAEDGSFPQEMRRTKPYGYSLFNLDVMTALVHILSSDSKVNLWNYQTDKGLSIKKGIEFMYPYVVDKSKWPLKPDVMYWEEWPVAHPFLLFGASAYNRKEWFNAWTKLKHQLTVEEVVRNMPVKYPLIWM
ncbi:hypothetical protein Pedsa_0844 [Pseudopedobacter saltans DSM 12145]|uniref:Alginate lyase domain-containing protein n=1 Tax=Pseudopedobacter saltans (strain ATCC 51119 / DSM 12145 / JCM 21818 / CCUG 39354 / LMG 10337 / NBRC 100064 / NCIMB 13643) TaxID=762903 RepID=F0S9R0_PSESL|nr:alginate lyase family protein [Pseudopedobacter saltans]ADY51416.1 hypothetical protein Pedsa_0844 [Pseudopedobacter saltans DSM 12145]